LGPQRNGKSGRGKTIVITREVELIRSGGGVIGDSLVEITGSNIDRMGRAAVARTIAIALGLGIQACPGNGLKRRIVIIPLAIANQYRRVR